MLGYGYCCIKKKKKNPFYVASRPALSSVQLIDKTKTFYIHKATTQQYNEDFFFHVAAE